MFSDSTGDGRDCRIISWLYNNNNNYQYFWWSGYGPGWVQSSGTAYVIFNVY